MITICTIGINEEITQEPDGKYIANKSGKRKIPQRGEKEVVMALDVPSLYEPKIFWAHIAAIKACTQ